jgi:hypothetical protein
MSLTLMGSLIDTYLSGYRVYEISSVEVWGMRFVVIGSKELGRGESTVGLV